MEPAEQLSRMRPCPFPFERKREEPTGRAGAISTSLPIRVCRQTPGANPSWPSLGPTHGHVLLTSPSPLR